MGCKITIFHIYNAQELLRVMHITLGISNQVKKEKYISSYGDIIHDRIAK